MATLKEPYRRERQILILADFDQLSVLVDEAGRQTGICADGSGV
jgi:hypothetical protein